MLNGNITASREDSNLFYQFEKLLLQEGVPLQHYEKNEFTEKYLADFMQQRQIVLKDLETESSRLVAFNTRDHVALYKRAFEKIGITEEGRVLKMVDSLAALAHTMDLTQVDNVEFLKAFIHLEENRKSATDAKNAIESLSKNADAIERDLAHLSQIVTQAKSDFESWGKADCRRGIEDLKTATAGVLAKKEEYRRRLETLNLTLESELGIQGQQIQKNTINTVDLMEEIMAKQKSLKQLEEKLEPFNKLPPDLTLASIEVERARAELGRPIWYYFEESQNWLPAYSEEIAEGNSLQLSITLEDGTVKTLTVNSKLEESKILPRNVTLNEDYLDDLTGLSHLHEASVMNTLKCRYLDGTIYTLSGMVLVAINPYCDLPIYGSHEMRAASLDKDAPPHIYAIAASALKALQQEERDQSIIISGESGAGKTVSAKWVMKYIAEHSRSDNCSFSSSLLLDEENPSLSSQIAIEKRVLATNPILEAFGNARTVRNDNSSRFGKYIQIHFSDKGVVDGATIQTYLLEKSRLVKCGERERNFHVFYQMMAGAPKDWLREFGLEAGKPYHYLHGDLDLSDEDSRNFEALHCSMEEIGFQQGDIKEVFRMLAAILLLGEVEFSNDGDGVSVSENSTLEAISSILGIPCDGLKHCLTKRTIKVVNEAISTENTLQEALATRDALAKLLYASLFDWIVSQLNMELAPKDPRRFIGILDIYGFENFDENSLEQFCINYANEKLQNVFNKHVFEVEQRLYAEEGIEWKNISHRDNNACISLIESKLGVLDLLNEECRFPNGSDTSFCQKLTSHNKNHENFATDRLDEDGSFIIKHFAYDVRYRVEGFLEKNRDSITVDVIKALKSSSWPFLQKVLAESAIDEGGGRGFIGERFRRSLDALMKLLYSTHTHYVRCIKSNQNKESLIFDDALVLHQLQSCGVLETIKISSLGYPGRWPFAEFINRYGILHPDIKSVSEAKDTCHLILSAAALPEDSYQIGHTKIFLRAGVLADLEHARTLRIRNAARSVQSHVRYSCSKRLLIRMKSSRLIQSHLKRSQSVQLASRLRLKALTLVALMKWRLVHKEYCNTLTHINTIQVAFKVLSARHRLLSLSRQSLSGETLELNEEGPHLSLPVAPDLNQTVLTEEPRLVERDDLATELKSQLEAANDLIRSLEETNGELFDRVTTLEEELRVLRLEKIALEMQKFGMDQKSPPLSPPAINPRSPSLTSSANRPLSPKLIKWDSVNAEAASILQDPMTIEEILMVISEAYVPVDDDDVSAVKENLRFPCRILENFTISWILSGAKELELREAVRRVFAVVKGRCLYGLDASADSRQDTIDPIIPFWIANILDYSCLLQQLVADMAKETSEQASNGKAGSSSVALVLIQLRTDALRIVEDIYRDWLRRLLNFFGSLGCSAILDHQGLSGFSMDDLGSRSRSSTTFFGTSRAPARIEDLLNALDDLTFSLQSCFLQAEVVQQLMNTILSHICRTSLNVLLERRRFATWKRGLQIQYNLSRLDDWASCTNSQHPNYFFDTALIGQNASESSRSPYPDSIVPEVAPLNQAVKLLQLAKTRVAGDVKGLCDACPDLNLAQIRRVLMIYVPDTLEDGPVEPQILRELTQLIGAMGGNLTELAPLQDARTVSLQLNVKPRSLVSLQGYPVSCIPPRLWKALVLMKLLTVDTSTTPSKNVGLASEAGSSPPR